MERESNPGILKKLFSPRGRRIAGYTALVAAGLGLGVVVDRSLIDRTPYDGISIVTTNEEDPGFTFAVIDSSSGEDHRLFEGRVDCTGTGTGSGVNASFTKFLPAQITDAQKQAFQTEAAGVCPNGQPIAANSQLIIANALTMSGVLGEVLSAHR